MWNVTLKWNVCEQQVLPLLFLADLFWYRLDFDRESPFFSALSLILVKWFMPVVVSEQVYASSHFLTNQLERDDHVPITHFARLNFRDFRHLKHFAKFKSREKKKMSRKLGTRILVTFIKTFFKVFRLPVVLSWNCKPQNRLCIYWHLGQYFFASPVSWRYSRKLWSSYRETQIRRCFVFNIRFE